MNYIFVLAGGIKENNKPHNFVIKRLDKSIELYQKSNNSKIIILGGGTYHKPPGLDSNNYVIHESTSCAKYLIDKGINEKDILREWYSYDTIANGYFAFLNYIQPLNIEKCYIITSQFHMERTKTIFNYFNYIICNNKINLTYIETSNLLNDNILNSRIIREKNSNRNFINNIVKKNNSLKDFSLWFYTEHNAYKSNISYYQDYSINKTY